MDFLGDTNTASALDVVFFVREIMETNQKLRSAILARLLDSFTQIRSSRVCTCSLWIIGEYSDSDSNIHQAMEVRARYPPPLITSVSVLRRRDPRHACHGPAAAAAGVYTGILAEATC